MLKENLFSKNNKIYTNVLKFLLGVDIVLIMLSVSRLILRRYFDAYQGILLSDSFSIIYDRGIGEFFQYFKELAIFILFILMAMKTKQNVYLSWGALFLYLLLDDSLKIHETLGGVLATKFQMISFWKFRGQDMGELIVVGVVGIVMLIFLAFGYMGASKEHQAQSKVLGILLVALVGFGVFLDVIISAFDWYELRMIFHLIEDGGEMVVMSIIFWVVLLFSNNDKNYWIPNLEMYKILK